MILEPLVTVKLLWPYTFSNFQAKYKAIKNPRPIWKILKPVRANQSQDTSADIFLKNIFEKN